MNNLDMEAIVQGACNVAKKALSTTCPASVHSTGPTSEAVAMLAGSLVSVALSGYNIQAALKNFA